MNNSAGKKIIQTGLGPLLTQTYGQGQFDYEFDTQ
jgi:hypothetical protein